MRHAPSRGGSGQPSFRKPVRTMPAPRHTVIPVGDADRGENNSQPGEPEFGQVLAT